MKIFGKTFFEKENVVSLSKKQKQVSSTEDSGRARRATTAIKKTFSREVTFEIADIKSALTSANHPELPDRKKLIQILKYIMRDGHLKSQIRTAKMKVLSEPGMMYRNGVPDEAATLLVRKKWFNQIIEYILEAEFWDYSLVECDNLDPNTSVIGSVELIDREYVSIDKKWILIEGTIQGAYLPYADIKDEMDLLEFGGKHDFGILLECAYNVIYKNYSRSDWSRANEKVGTPALTIIADTNNPDELDDLEEKASNFSNDGFFVGQKGDQIALLERKNDNFHVTFKDNISYCDDQNSKIVNGQTGTSDEKSFVGSANVHERVMEDYTIARLQNVVDEMRDNVVPYLVKKGWNLDGCEWNYPYLIRLMETKINGPQPIVSPSTEVPPAPEPAPAK
jgi:hypothetical protein